MRHGTADALMHPPPARGVAQTSAVVDVFDVSSEPATHSVLSLSRARAFDGGQNAGCWGGRGVVVV